MNKSSESDMNQPKSEIFISYSRQQLRSMDFDPRTPDKYIEKAPPVEVKNDVPTPQSNMFNQKQQNSNQLIANNDFNQQKNDKTQPVVFKIVQSSSTLPIPSLKNYQGQQTYQINQGQQKYNTPLQQGAQFQFNQYNQNKQIGQYNQFPNQPAFYQQK
ncbi:unnamed protein product (macronuclear) [Paramecium tetraurelia]|uniref:Uncharacterized protein n=1 Tax=Paramecium tetraurelia TaxID=5888 RepID=A0C2F0_PARTE|nr:uncharacterized protein GSPATT00034445001 [Paramecium tetraurelia]CAK64967.1 unnamed protein product [Paramecium tetraurelia]|eukprot:XP_001432364.1 hypothetical protein (macronuclear) [Paramecium tetraurelia strain d4-2]